MRAAATIAILATAVVAVSCAPSGNTPASPGSSADVHPPLPAPVSTPTPPAALTVPTEQPKASTPEQRAALEAEFRKACAASGDEAHRLAKDLNGDGRADSLCWRNYHSPEIGDGAQLLFEVNGQDRYVDVTLSHVTVEVEPWSAAFNKDFDLDKSPGPIVVIVSDGDTDPLMLFWQDDDGSGKPGIASARM